MRCKQWQCNSLFFPGKSTNKLWHSYMFNNSNVMSSRDNLSDGNQKQKKNITLTRITNSSKYISYMIKNWSLYLFYTQMLSQKIIEKHLAVHQHILISRKWRQGIKGIVPMIKITRNERVSYINILVLTVKRPKEAVQRLSPEMLSNNMPKVLQTSQRSASAP